MDREDYQNLFLEAARLDVSKPLKVEFDIDVQPGEDDIDAFMRFLIERGIMIPNGSQYDFDLEKAEEFDPYLRKIFEAMLQAEAHYQADQLIQNGLVYLTADETGNMLFEYTEEGQRWLDENQE